MKRTKKRFYRYINSKRKGKGWKTEKAEVLSPSFASVSTSKASLQGPQAPDTKVQNKADLPMVEEEHVRDH